MTMRHFTNPSDNKVYGYDSAVASQLPYIERAIAAKWPEITGSWPPAPTAAEVAQATYNAAIAAGVQITSTGTPALNGTYSITPSTIADIQAQQVSILTRDLFTNGSTTRVWADILGGVHVFPSTAQFTAFAEAIGAYVDALFLAQHGQGSWPSNAITIY